MSAALGVAGDVVTLPRPARGRLPQRLQGAGGPAAGGTGSEGPAGSGAPTAPPTLPPRWARQRGRPAPTWPPAAAGSPATSRPSGPSPPWTPRPSGRRAARSTARWSPGAAAPRPRPLPWRGEGSASPSDPAPTARSRHGTAGSSRRAAAHFRWGELESVTRSSGPGGQRAHARPAPAPSGEPTGAGSWIHVGAGGAGTNLRVADAPASLRSGPPVLGQRLWDTGRGGWLPETELGLPPTKAGWTCQNLEAKAGTVVDFIHVYTGGK